MPRYKVTKAPLDGTPTSKRSTPGKIKKSVVPKKQRAIEPEPPQPTAKPTARQLAELVKAGKAAKTGTAVKHKTKGALHADTVDFLCELQQHNDREWFADHKSQYEHARQDFENFAGDVIVDLSTLDPALSVLQAKSCTYRIFRDVRFGGGSSDPYKTYMAAGFSRTGKKSNNAMYYLHVEPGNKSMIAGGMWCPPKDIVANLRASIAANPQQLREVLADPEMVRYFGKEPLDTDEQHVLKTAPKGYSRDHESIDLLRFKSFIVRYPLKDEDLTSDGLLSTVQNVFTAMTPFLRRLNEMAGL